MATRHQRRGRKGALLLQHLEGVSWRVLEEYPELIRDMIRGESGVYALYRRDRLYYVGLASNLMGRLKSHLRDRHHSSWDRFSVYLTARTEHIKELESLLLRIVSPEGNKQGGRFVRSENLFSTLSAWIKEANAERLASLLGGPLARRWRKKRAKGGQGQAALEGIAERAMSLRCTFKGRTHRARLRRDGSISYRGKIYSSPTAAARAIVKGPVHGWNFWYYRKAPREWVPLKTLRQ